MALFGPLGGRGRGGGSSRSNHVAVLDLGGATTKCLIAEHEPGEDPRVIGIGKAASHGIKAGAVVDMDAAEADIRAAVEEAERMAETAVNAVSVSFAGGQLMSHGLVGETLLSEKPTGDRDLRRALSAALEDFEADDRVVLHAIPLSWSIDEHAGVRDPRGMFGRSLAVDVHVVSASAGPVRNLALCLERARLGLRSVVATPYAAGLATLVDDETDLGVTLIDMGGQVTSAAVFIDGALVHVDAAPIGGAHISSDLARGLSTPVADAERIKRRFGSLIERPGDADDLIDCPQLGEERSLLQAPRQLVRDIIRPRLEETFEIMRDRLNAAGVLRAAGPRAVLTGGAARLGGVGRVATQVLGKRVRIASPFGVEGLPDGDDGPEMAAAAGLLRHVCGGPREALAGPPKTADELRPRDDFGSIRKAAGWLKKNF